MDLVAVARQATDILLPALPLVYAGGKTVEEGSRRFKNSSFSSRILIHKSLLNRVLLYLLLSSTCKYHSTGSCHPSAI